MGTPKKTYPIVKTDGETIYLMGREFQEGTDEYFTERDRIQAMIASDIVLIVSEIDGGSMHAIKWAKKMNKSVWCFKINSSGNMDLIDNYKKFINYASRSS